jgi:hypothetical protein
MTKLRINSIKICTFREGKLKRKKLGGVFEHSKESNLILVWPNGRYPTRVLLLLDSFSSTPPNFSFYSEKIWETFSKIFSVNFTEIYTRKKLRNMFSEIFCMLQGENETRGWKEKLSIRFNLNPKSISSFFFLVIH